MPPQSTIPFLARFFLALVIFASMPVSYVRAADAAPTALDISSRLELFVDDFLIERLDGARLKLHEPHPANVALRFDAPWEGAFSGYVTVLHDGERFRCYYRGNPIAGRDGSDTEVTCYAESRDGINFTKPALGLFEVHGTRSNNVVLAGQAPFSHNFAPFLDSRPGVPAAERFKALAGTSERGLFGFVSADGLRWRKLRETPLITKGAFDSQNVAFWSASEQCYALYLRTWTGGDFAGFRTISRATSTNFLDWSAPVEMSFGDTPREHLYTSQTHPYFRAPHIYVATPMRFLPGRKALDRRTGPYPRRGPRLCERYGGNSLHDHAGRPPLHPHLHGRLHPARSRPRQLGLARRPVRARHRPDRSGRDVALQAGALRAAERPSRPLHAAHGRLRLGERAVRRRRAS